MHTVLFVYLTMSCGNLLTEEEQHKIMSLQSSGNSTCDTATALGRSKKLVRTFMKASERYGKARRRGRPSKLLATDKRILIREAHKREKSARKIWQDMDLPTGKEHVERMTRDTATLN